MAQAQDTWLASAAGIFFGWAVLSWTVRVGAKLRAKAWALDDYAISGSLLAALLHLIFVSHAIRHGYGTPIDQLSASNATEVQMGLYLGQLFYILSFGLCRMAAAIFIAQVSHYPSPFIKPAQVAAVIAAVWTVASALAIVIRGDVVKPWTLLDGSPQMFIRWLVIEITGMMFDLALWAIATHLVWRIQLKLSKRIFLVCAFGAGCILVMPLLIARLVLLDPRTNSGSAQGATTADLVTEACMNFYIFASSTASLKSLLTPYYPANSSSTERTASTSVLRTKDRADGGRSYYRVETPKPATVANDRGGCACKAVVLNRVPIDDIAWQPALGTSAAAYSKLTNSISDSATCSVVNTRPEQGSGNRKRDSLTEALKSSWAGRRGQHVSWGSDDSGPIIIQKMTEVTVQYR